MELTVMIRGSGDAGIEEPAPEAKLRVHCRDGDARQHGAAQETPSAEIHRDSLIDKLP
jgi:hypothetical protein